jgi:hypothetical protein
MLPRMRREASIEVSKLLEASSESLQLTLLSDWGSLDRKIAHMRIQKPGSRCRASPSTRTRTASRCSG